MPGWDDVSDRLASDPHWQSHVDNAGDITVHGQERSSGAYRNANGFGTGNGTDNGLIQLRKFRQLKTMILFLQEAPEFGKYCYYGCWCFIDGSDNLQTGYGPPRDNIDEACMDFSKCYRCLAMDYPDFEETLRYNFEMLEHDDGSKSVECNDPSGTMKRNLCECDRELAMQLAEHENEWSVQYSEQQSDFDRKKQCFTPLNQKYEVDQCCGSYPARYPYSSRQGVKDCCGNKVYSNEFSQCCAGGNIKGNDETC